MTPFRATMLCDRIQSTYITRDFTLYLKIWMEEISQKLFSIKAINSAVKNSASTLLEKSFQALKTSIKQASYIETSKQIIYSATSMVILKSQTQAVRKDCIKRSAIVIHEQQELLIGLHPKSLMDYPIQRKQTCGLLAPLLTNWPQDSLPSDSSKVIWMCMTPLLIQKCHQQRGVQLSSTI